MVDGHYSWMTHCHDDHVPSWMTFQLNHKHEAMNQIRYVVPPKICIYIEQFLSTAQCDKKGSFISRVLSAASEAAVEKSPMWPQMTL